MKYLKPYSNCKLSVWMFQNHQRTQLFSHRLLNINFVAHKLCWIVEECRGSFLKWVTGMPGIILWSNGFLINIFHDLVSGWLNAECSSTPEKRFSLLLGVICIKIPFCLSFSLSSLFVCTCTIYIGVLRRTMNMVLRHYFLCLVVVTIFLLVMQATPCVIS